eukprot:COSAG06_NODE_4387_length_4310_cov_19.067205_3_plen_216_part_00
MRTAENLAQLSLSFSLSLCSECLTMLAGSRSRVAATARQQATDTKRCVVVCVRVQPCAIRRSATTCCFRRTCVRHDTRAATALLLRASAPAIILHLAEPTLTSRRFSSLPLRRRENISPRKQAFEIDEWLRQLRLSVQNAKQRVEEQVRNYLVPIRLHPPSSHAPGSVSYSYRRLFSHSHSQRPAPSASIMWLYQHPLLVLLCCAVWWLTLITFC